METRLQMVLGSSFNTCGGWLESLFKYFGSLFGFWYGLIATFSRLNWISKTYTTNKLALTVMANL